MEYFNYVEVAQGIDGDYEFHTATAPKSAEQAARIAGVITIFVNKKPEQILKLAVKRMLPGGPLAKKQLSKLKIYKGDNHPHESQNPTIVDFSKMNSKNYISTN